MFHMNPTDATTRSCFTCGTKHPEKDSTYRDVDVEAIHPHARISAHFTCTSFRCCFLWGAGWSQEQNLSEDELAAREAENAMQGSTHNLLNQSVAAGYRSNGAISRQGSTTSLAGTAGARKDQEGSVKGENKRSKRPRPGGPTASPRAGPSSAPGGGGGAAAAAGVVVERPSAR